MARFRTPEGAAEMVALTGVTLLRREKDGQAYLCFDFDVAWDEEHGAAVVLLGDKVKKLGGAGAFSDR